MDKTLIAKYVKPLTPVYSGLQPRGRLDAPVRAFMFDVYGTLFISASDGSTQGRLDPERTRWLKELLEKTRQPLSIDQLMGLYQDAIADRHSKLRAQGIEFPEVDIELIWQEVLRLSPADSRQFALEFEFIVNPVYPMPGLGALLAACVSQSAAIGIISNAQFYTPYLFEWFLDADLSQIGFESDLVLLSYQFSHAKPSHKLFEEAVGRLRRNGVQAEEVLFVGNDMLNDIFPAQAIGFKTALYAGDKRSLRLRADDPRCRGIEPDLIITELDQLINRVAFYPRSDQDA